MNKYLKIIGSTALSALIFVGVFVFTTGIAQAAPDDVQEFVAENTMDATESSLFNTEEPEHVLDILIFLNQQIAIFRSQLATGGMGGDGSPFSGIVEALQVGNNEMYEFVGE